MGKKIDAAKTILGSKLGVAGVVGAGAVGVSSLVASSQVGPDGKVGDVIEDGLRTVTETTARVGVLARFEGLWSTLEQIFKAITAATGGELGGGVMNFSRKMQGLPPIGRNSDGNIDLNQIKTIDHTGNAPSTAGTAPTGAAPQGTTPAGTPPVAATQASTLGDSPLAVLGGLSLAGAPFVGGKLALDTYRAANTKDALMDRALSAEAAGKTARAETLFEKAAVAETRAATRTTTEVADALEDAAKATPRVTGKFGKAALGVGLIGGGTMALDVSQATASTEASNTTDAPSDRGFWSNVFQSTAAFTVGLGTGLAAIPEDVYDLADKYVLQGYLPGDENASGTRDGLYSGAKAIGIDLDNHQTALAGGELTSIFIPIAGIAGAVAKSERIVTAARGLERVSDGAGMIDLGNTGVQIAKSSLNLG